MKKISIKKFLKETLTDTNCYFFVTEMWVLAIWVFFVTVLNVLVYYSNQVGVLYFTLCLSGVATWLLPKLFDLSVGKHVYDKSLSVFWMIPLIFFVAVVLKVINSVSVLEQSSTVIFLKEVSVFTGEFAVVSLVSSVYVIITLALGREILLWIKYETDTWSIRQAVLSFGMGQTIVMFGMMVLGFMGLYYSTVIYLIAAIVLALFRKEVISIVRTFFSWKIHFTNRDLPSAEKKVWTISWLATILASVVFVLMIVNSFIVHPFVTDTLRAYISLPTIYAEQHSIVDYEASRYTYYPKNAEMLFTLGILLSDQNIVNFIVLFNLLGAVLWLFVIYQDLSSGQGRRAPPLLIAAFLLIPSIMYFGYGNAKVDMILLFYVLASIHTAILAVKKDLIEYVVLFGLFAGVAMGVKYTAAISIVAIFTALPMLVCRDWKKLIRIWFIAGGIMMIVMSPWLMRNYFVVGNPVAPFLLNSIHSEGNFFDQVGEDSFKSTLKSSRESTYYHLFNQEEKGLSYYISLPFRILSNATGFVMKMNDMGPLFMSLIFLLWAKKMYATKVAKYILLVVILHTLAYVFVVENTVLWYVLPMFPLLLLLYQISFDSLRVNKQKVIASLILFISLVSFFVHGRMHDFTKVKSSQITSSVAIGDYSYTRFEELRTLSEMLNSDKYSDGKIYFANDSAVYYLKNFHERVIPNVHFEMWGYYYDNGLSSDEILQRLKLLGVNYIIVNDFLVTVNIELLELSMNHSPNISSHYLGRYVSFGEFLEGFNKIYSGTTYSVYEI